MKVTFGVNSYDGYRDPFNTFIPEPILTVDLTWSTYVRILRYVASVPRLPCEKETDTKWSAPMILGNAGHRRADNIIGMSAFVGGDLDAPGWTMERLRGKLAGLRCVVHTTTHSRPEHQKFRIIVALDREHGVPEYPAVWAISTICWTTRSTSRPATSAVSCTSPANGRALTTSLRRSLASRSRWPPASHGRRACPSRHRRSTSGA